MAVLYQVEEQGRQTAFVGEKEGGFIESMAEPEEQPRPRSARSPRSTMPDTLDSGKEAE